MKRVMTDEVIDASALYYGLTAEEAMERRYADAMAARRLAALVMHLDGRSWTFIASRLGYATSHGVRRSLDKIDEDDRLAAKRILERLHERAERAWEAELNPVVGRDGECRS